MERQRYIYGSAARDYYQVLPEREQTVLERRQARKKEKRKISVMNGIISAAFVAAVIFTVLTCFQFLMLQAQTTVTHENIASLENKIAEVTVQNDAVEFELSGYKDIDYIYQTAIQELGMVEAAKNQISVYESIENEYLIQTGDIPEE